MLSNLDIYKKILNSFLFSVILLIILGGLVYLIYKTNTQDILKVEILSDKNINKESKQLYPKSLFILNSSLIPLDARSTKEIIDNSLKSSISNTPLATAHKNGSNQDKIISDKQSTGLKNLSNINTVPTSRTKEEIPSKPIQVKTTSTPKPPTPTKELVTPTPSPKLEYHEEINSTLEERDKEKVLVTQILSNKISEYYFLYSQLPNIYEDKSKTELTSIPSDIIYLYNGNENKSNSLGLTLGSEKKGFQFSRVVSCENNKSYENKIFFAYSEFEIKLCKEDGNIESFWIAH